MTMSREMAISDFHTYFFFNTWLPLMFRVLQRIGVLSDEMSVSHAGCVISFVRGCSSPIAAGFLGKPGDFLGLCSVRRSSAG